MTKTLSAEDFDFSKATPVIADANKPRLLIPVGNTAGHPLVYPDGPKKGDFIGDDYNPPIKDKLGLVFLNATENNYVRLPTDGTGYIIMNSVNEEKGKLIVDKVHSFNKDPEKLTEEQYLEVVKFAHSIGVTNTYNTDDKYVLGNPEKNKPAAFINSKESFDATGERPFGLYTRAQDTLKAIFVEGPVNISGRHVIGGEFPNGAVVVDTKADITPIQPDIALDTYLKADGTKLALSDIAVGKLKAPEAAPAPAAPAAKLG